MGIMDVQVTIDIRHKIKLEARPQITINQEGARDSVWIRISEDITNSRQAAKEHTTKCARFTLSVITRV